MIESFAQAVVNRARREAGYNILWLDSGWCGGHRDSAGNLNPPSSKWPNGMKGCADAIHALGLKAGIYIDAGPSFPKAAGAGGHYEQDAASFAEWGFDAVKIDCMAVQPQGLDPRELVPEFIAALRATDRELVISACNPWTATHVPEEQSCSENWRWASKIAESWRTSTDIGSPGNPTGFSAVLYHFDQNGKHPEAAGPGHWNDPDYIKPDGLTLEELRAYFSLWVIAAAPLMISADISKLTQAVIALLTNREAIMINQDPLGIQGVANAQSTNIIVKPLHDSSRAVVLLNRGQTKRQMQLFPPQVGMTPGLFHGHDVWRGTKWSARSQLALTVPAQGCRLLRLWPS